MTCGVLMGRFKFSGHWAFSSRLGILGGIAPVQLRHGWLSRARFFQEAMGQMVSFVQRAIGFMINIEAVYASPQQEQMIALQVPPGTPLSKPLFYPDARTVSEILPSPGWCVQSAKELKVFSGDRIEITDRC